MNRETTLQNQIIVALNEVGCYAVNHTVGLFYSKNGTPVNIGHHGESDIWGHRADGKAFYIEVKLPNQNPRQDQKDFINAMRKSGAIAGVARSVRDAYEIIGYKKQSQP